MSTSINVPNQDDLTNNDDSEFWQNIGAIEDNKLIEVIADKHPVSPLKEVPSAPKPNGSKTGSLPFNPKLVEWMQSLLNYHCCSRSLILNSP